MTDRATRHDTACPADEWLVAYLTSGLSPTEHVTVETHAGACERCAGTLQRVARRLAIAAEIPVRVPAAVIERVHPAAPRPAAAPMRAPAGWLDRLREAGATLVRLPVLIPVSVALGALLMLATQSLLSPTTPHEMSRSLPLRQQVRVTAAEAVVHVEPNPQAAIVATLARGATVTVQGDARQWLHVALPDGAQGWVERRAFE